MAQFECRIIERLVRVYRVEAKDADEADMLLQIGDSRLYQVDSFPIDSEDGEAPECHPFSAASSRESRGHSDT